MTPSELTVPLISPCDACGAEKGVLVSTDGSRPEHLCPRCTQYRALHESSWEQLEVLLRQAVRLWLYVWGSDTSLPDLDEQLAQVGVKLKEEYDAGTLEARA